ncbi:MAG: ankyrin repeat domain-containing protein, partial [bacterium]
MPATRSLPDSPDLDQLRRQAKELLRDSRDADPHALGRFRILPSLARASDDELAIAPLALHDAQSAIAREHGFPSWNALRERVEELTLNFDDAVREFIEAATDGRTSRAERLLTLRPRITSASVYSALVLGDSDAVASHMAAHPEFARERGGPRNWEPIHYVCHTSLGATSAASAHGLVEIAKALLALGVDPNTRFPWMHHDVYRPVLWGATRATRVAALVELLLTSGANPNDGVTFTLAAGAGDLETLTLLRAHGADSNQAWATDGSNTLYAILHWATTPRGVQWILEHGAYADPVFAANGETPLHVAARRWDVAMTELLVHHGADISRPRADGRTPYAVAELNGNRPVAEWLRTHGALGELSDVDRLVAACGRGDRDMVESMLATRPSMRDEIAVEHYVALQRAAE